ncbi:MAG: hypothetical protein RBR19_09850 [Sedimentisphaerales bacterium]|jgi:hypothetical protein|nr:hypothetical protein [Sedimentisphaerales bacterium]
MIRVVSKGLWKEIRALAKQGSAKAAAIAYVSSEEISFGEGDILVTDASDGQIASGQTVAAILGKALKRGATVYSLAGLHAKVIVLDRIAVIGSGNMSGNSADERTIEAAIITDVPSAVSSARGLIEDLAKRATPVDRRFIQRISAIEVERRPQASGHRRKPVQVRTRDSRTWIVSINPLDEDRYQDERELVKKGTAKAETRKKSRDSDVTWIRMTGKSGFRTEAREGDSVVQIWTNAKRTRVKAVYPHSTILSRQKEPGCTRFFVEQARSIEDNTLAWSDFKRLLRSVGVSWTPTRRCTRELPPEYDVALHAMWGKSK